MRVHYPDLGTECQIASGPRVRAVGWLASDHEFERGPVETRVVEALGRLIEDGWVHLVAAGPHLCELCQRARDGRNVLVPGSGVLYVAPAMIVHYIADHSYSPPPDFCAAVVSCPPPSTDAYFAELRSFLDVFSPNGRMRPEDFDRYARRHRESRERIAAERAAERTRKKFTWD